MRLGTVLWLVAASLASWLVAWLVVRGVRDVCGELWRLVGG
jgi:hypothetical protein